MAKVLDLINSVGFGDDGISLAYPDTFLDDIRASYDEDMSIPTAKITGLEADLAAAQAEIANLKIHMYDLINQVPDTSDSDDSDDSESDSDSDNDDSDNSGVDSLFE